MTRIGMGLVGAGFVGPHHVDAVRRLGFVDIAAVAGSTEESGRSKAAALGARRGYGSYQALIDDPDVQVVHVATPNHLHAAVTSAALARGKHVVCDKPLARTAAEARHLVEQARRAGVVTAVTFNYRGNPLVQHARQAVAGGEIGTPRFVHGQYLQDWLIKDTDYSWRLDPDKGGASSALGDIGSHWCDLAEHLTGLRITEVPTVLRRDRRPRRPHLRTWRDGWRHLRFLLLYSPRWLYLYPGALLVMLGTLVGARLLVGPIAAGGIGLDVHTLIYAAAAVIVGYQGIVFALFTKIFAVSEGLLPEDPRLPVLFRYLTLEAGLVVGLGMVIVGVGLGAWAVRVWSAAGFGALGDESQLTLRLAIVSATALALGWETVLASFFLSVLGLRRR